MRDGELTHQVANKLEQVTRLLNNKGTDLDFGRTNKSQTPASKKGQCHMFLDMVE